MLEIRSCAYPIAISRDAKLFLHGSARSMVSLYEIENRKKLASMKVAPYICSAEFSPDSDRVALMDSSGNIFVIDLSGEILMSIEGDDLEGTLHFGKCIARVATNGVIDLFDPTTGQQVARHRGFKCLRGSTLVESQLIVAHVRIDEFMIPHFQRYKVNGLEPIGNPIELPLNANHVQWGVSTSGKILWSASYDDSYNLTFFDWDLCEIGVVDFRGGRIGFVEFSPNDDEVAVLRQNTGITRYKFPALQPIDDQPEFDCMKYSADGRLFALGGAKRGMLMAIAD